MPRNIYGKTLSTRGVRIDVRIFFDRQNVERQIGLRNKRILLRTGAYGMKTMRGLLNRKSTKAPADPGEPPRKILGHIKRLTFFGFDPATKSVVVGPQVFGASKRTTKPIGRKTVPELLDKGGRARVRLPRTRYDQTKVWKKSKYPRRPFRDEAQRRTAPFMRRVSAEVPLKV